MYFRKNCIVVDTTDLTHAKLVSLTSPCCSGEPRPPVQRAPVTWREWGLWWTPRTTFCSSNGLVLGKPIDRLNVKSTYTTDTRRNNNGIIASKRHRFSVINALSLRRVSVGYSYLPLYQHIHIWRFWAEKRTDILQRNFNMVTHEFKGSVITDCCCINHGGVSYCVLRCELTTSVDFPYLSCFKTAEPGLDVSDVVSVGPDYSVFSAFFKSMMVVKYPQNSLLCANDQQQWFCCVID